MNEDNREEPDMFENIDCCDAFNTSKVLIQFCILLK